MKAMVLGLSSGSSISQPSPLLFYFVCCYIGLPELSLVAEAGPLRNFTA